MNYKRILVALSPTDGRDAAFERALALAKKSGAELYLRLKQKALAVGSRDAEPIVVTGDASRGIVETATITAADLIVMGVAPRTWIDGAVSGSTLRAVLRRAKTPVLVVPVVGGGHEWIAELQEDTIRTTSTADWMTPAA
jgi:nucleotide-binding universal stress UspA family protein